MFWRASIILAAITGLLAFYASQNQTASPSYEYVSGKNKTAFFIVLEHRGFCNVHLATAQSLMELHPDIKLHFASFPSLASDFPRILKLARTRQPKAQEISFHELRAGLPYRDACALLPSVAFDAEHRMEFLSPPGLLGIKKMAVDFQSVIDPWSAEDHLALHNEIATLIQKIDPAIVVLDTIFGPAIEATRGLNRTHAFITPNTAIDNFAAEQPHGKMLWKYPAMGSGFPYPVPWHLIPMNIYLNARFIFSVLRLPELSKKRKFLREHGVKDPINFYGLHRPDVPWLTQTTPGAAIPVEVIPQNVTCTGPMVLALASAAEQDPELAHWIARRPTVLINLGSGFVYSPDQIKQMIATIRELLRHVSPKLHVLWKLRLAPPAIGSYDWKKVVAPLESTGRVRVYEWLDVDPAALLQSGSIVVSVNHGGSNAYHEALEAGVPQVILPMWIDLYNYASLAEQVGVGLWACREKSPDFEPDCLSSAILTLAKRGPRSSKISQEARAMGERLREKPGREVAAKVIAELARSGHRPASKITARLMGEKPFAIPSGL